MRAELFWVSQKGGASAPCLLDLPLPFPTVDPGSQVEAPAWSAASLFHWVHARPARDCPKCAAQAVVTATPWKVERCRGLCLQMSSLPPVARWPPP